MNGTKSAPISGDADARRKLTLLMNVSRSCAGAETPI
jgi:hypothetical protein